MSGNNTECETSTPEINLPDSNDNGKYSLEDISTFAKQGLTSSWGVSNTDAELLFLKTKQAQQSIRKISDQDKSNLTSDQLNANQTQLDALNGEVESQTTAIQTIKTSLETEEVNLEKAQRILKAIKTSSNDQEIADALG
jgi:flagellar biosynthesis chaperone FliJ